VHDYYYYFMFVISVSVARAILFLRFWLSVPVQLTAWKDSSPKWPVICRVGC